MSSKAGASTIAKRYVTAFLDLVGEGKELDSVSKDVDSLITIFANSLDLTKALKNPIISGSEKQGVIEAIVKKAKLKKITAKFLGLLIENRRINMVELILNEVKKEIAKRRGEITADITSATKLSAKQVKALSDSLKKAIGSEVELKLNINPEIIGGLVITIGSNMIDNSVRTKLHNLKKVMKAEGAYTEEAQIREVA